MKAFPHLFVTELRKFSPPLTENTGISVRVRNLGTLSPTKVCFGSSPIFFIHLLLSSPFPEIEFDESESHPLVFIFIDPFISFFSYRIINSPAFKGQIIPDSACVTLLGLL